MEKSFFSKSSKMHTKTSTHLVAQSHKTVELLSESSEKRNHNERVFLLSVAKLVAQLEKLFVLRKNRKLRRNRRRRLRSDEHNQHPLMMFHNANDCQDVAQSRGSLFRSSYLSDV